MEARCCWRSGVVRTVSLQGVGAGDCRPERNWLVEELELCEEVEGVWAPGDEEPVEEVPWVGCDPGAGAEFQVGAASWEYFTLTGTPSSRNLMLRRLIISASSSLLLLEVSEWPLICSLVSAACKVVGALVCELTESSEYATAPVCAIMLAGATCASAIVKADKQEETGSDSDDGPCDASGFSPGMKQLRRCNVGRFKAGVAAAGSEPWSSSDVSVAESSESRSEKSSGPRSPCFLLIW